MHATALEDKYFGKLGIAYAYEIASPETFPTRVSYYNINYYMNRSSRQRVISQRRMKVDDNFDGISFKTDLIKIVDMFKRI